MSSHQYNFPSNFRPNDAFYEKLEEYQPSGPGGTRSPPATPYRLQHLTARLIQNGRQGLEKG